jgi:hypothetical protein
LATLPAVLALHVVVAWVWPVLESFQMPACWVHEPPAPVSPVEATPVTSPGSKDHVREAEGQVVVLFLLWLAVAYRRPRK